MINKRTTLKEGSDKTDKNFEDVLDSSSIQLLKKIAKGAYKQFEIGNTKGSESRTVISEFILTLFTRDYTNKFHLYYSQKLGNCQLLRIPFFIHSC